MFNEVRTLVNSQAGAMLDTISTAHDLANASTQAYRATKQIEFKHVLSKGTDPVSFAAVPGQRIDFTQGEISKTDNVLDVALMGENGFFAIQTPDGRTLYSRLGHFSLAPDGTLVNVQGYPVLDIAQGPIKLTQDQVKNLRINPYGELSTTAGTQSQTITRLGIFSFDDITQLTRAGTSFFTTTQTPFQPAPGVHAIQGALEDSNVNPLQSVASLMEQNRHFGMLQNLIQQSFEGKQSSLNKFTKSMSKSS